MSALTDERITFTSLKATISQCNDVDMWVCMTCVDSLLVENTENDRGGQDVGDV